MEKSENRYAKWLTGELSDEALRTEEGGDTLADLDRIVKTVDTWSMPSYNTSAGYEKFKQKHSAKAVKVRKINWFAISSIAASFLILIFCWFTFMNDDNQVIFAELGQNTNIALSDGSSIILNDGSTVEYNEENWSDNRNVELAGEAKFSVSKGTSFTVNTPNGSIEVLGTQFNVRAWGANLYVECYEGKVRVSADGQETILTASESVNIVSGKMNTKQMFTHKDAQWRSGTSRFYDEDITGVIKELERQYEINIETTLSNQSFSGSFSHNNLEDALKSICIPLGLEYQISDDQKEVFIK